MQTLRGGIQYMSKGLAMKLWDAVATAEAFDANPWRWKPTTIVAFVHFPADTPERVNALGTFLRWRVFLGHADGRLGLTALGYRLAVETGHGLRWPAGARIRWENE